MSTHVAIAGSSSFIGKTLVPFLRKYGYTVIELPREVSACDLSGVEVVVNLVGRAHVLHETSVNAQEAYHAVNCQYAFDLFAVSVSYNVKLFIQISSIGVLGDRTLSLPFSHRSPLAPKGEYAISKAEAEKKLINMASKSATQLCVIRPPLVYGPNAKGNLQTLRRIIEKGVPLPLGAIHNHRDFVSIYNLCDLIRTCIDNPAAAGELFLVSDNEPISTTQLVRYLSVDSCKKVWLVPVPSCVISFFGRLTGKSTTVEKLTADLEIDISYTMQKLSWHPPFSVAESFAKISTSLCGES